MPVDLSTLSDEQLDAYKSLLASKQPQTLTSEGSTDAAARGAGHVPSTSAPKVPMEYSGSGIGSMANVDDSKLGPIQMSTPFVGGGSVAKALIPSAVGYGVGLAGHAVGLPDWANTGLALASGALAHGTGRVIGDPEVQDAAMAFNPYKKALNLGTAIANKFRAPVQGPEQSPPGYQSPYPTLPYEQPLPAIGPRPAFQGQDFTPPVFDRSAPVGQPGAVLPSGSIVGPAPPSRVNPPEPRGNPPRASLTQRIGIPSAAGPGPLPDLSPIYPASPVLPSGRSFGPRPSGDVNPGIVINGPIRPPLATGTNQVAVPQLTPIQPPFASSKEAAVFSNSSPHAGPYGTRATLGTQAEMMRQNRLARGLDAPQAEPLPANAPDTPATARARANQNRQKFDPVTGQNNQLRPKR